MARSKLEKFEEVRGFSNVYENSNDLELVKKELEKYTANADTIVELGCGRGEYTVALAEMFPDKNFIGVDIQGERIWHGAKYALENEIKNIRFLRIQIETLSEYLEMNSINEIWITFPDPFPKDKKTKKRLTSPRFLEMYKEILKPGGIINLKTDDEDLFDYSVETAKEFGVNILEATKDIYSKEEVSPVLEIKTRFERKWLKKGKKINYLTFSN